MNEEFDRQVKLARQQLKEVEIRDRKTMPLIYDKFSEEEKQFVSVFLTEAKKIVDIDNIIFNIKSGCINFKYKVMQIGRITLNKKRKMQILTSNRVVWLEDITLDEAMKNIDKWIIYLKYLKKIK